MGLSGDGMDGKEGGSHRPAAREREVPVAVGPLLPLDLVGKRVLITGSGPIGVLMVLVARRAGAAEIVVSDILDKPLEFAKAAGADQTVNGITSKEALAQYQAGKGYFDVQFECSGAARALTGGIAALRPGATLVQLGLGGDMQVPMQSLTAKEITLRGSFRFHPEFASGVDMMQKGLIDVKPLITHSLPLDAALTAFELASDREIAIKAQIIFQN